MAKLLTLWLVFIYAFSATGASVHLHYCCGKLQHLAMENERALDSSNCTLCLSHHEKNDHPDCDDNLRCDGDTQSHNHCQDIQVDAKKTTGDHLPSSEKSLLKVQSLELLVFTLIQVSASPASHLHHTGTTAVPPHLGNTPLFVQHCTYRI